MGMIGRLVKWGCRLGLAVLLLTAGAVLFLSNRNFQLYGEGRGLEAPVDAILVLGGGIDGDWVLGYSSRRRVAVAVDLLKAGRARYLIFSGGPGGIHPDFSAAGLMRGHALALGAPPEALLIESNSSSTFENLRFGFALAEAQGFTDLALLTDAFHLERSRWLASYFGRPDAGLIAAPGLERDGKANRVWSILREALAWWLNLAKIGGWEALDAVGMDVAARQELIK
jgi:uncharacterized SAM-binding protein YcdF (DUF218 family)